MIRNESAFTLLEAIVAVALFTIAFAEILNLQGRAINDAYLSKQYNTVARLARNKMTELESQVRGRQFQEVPQQASGNYSGDEQDFRWETKIKELKFPNFSNLLSGAQSDEKKGSPSAASGGMASQIGESITRFMNQSIRLMSVTIYWKRSSKEMSFTVSTFWVNLGGTLAI